MEPHEERILGSIVEALEKPMDGQKVVQLDDRDSVVQLELLVMQECWRLLRELDGPARSRAIAWLVHSNLALPTTTKNTEETPR